MFVLITKSINLGGINKDKRLQNESTGITETNYNWTR